MSARDLARLLTSHRTLRLVMLNACEGAKGDAHDIFSSTAATLAQRGIPAVLAMQEIITDKAAIQLTRTFYRALASGLPVNAAVAEARTAISVSLPHSLEWGTPVLFLRAPDSVLFDVTAKPLTTPIVAPPAPAPAAPPVMPPAAPQQTQEDKSKEEWKWPENPLTPPATPQQTKEGTGLLGGLFGRLKKTKEEWVKEGDAHLQAKRYEKALAAYEQAIKLDPNYVAAWNGKGTALRILKRYKEAYSAYDRAMKLDPTEVTAYDGASMTLRLEALVYAEETIRRAPTKGDGYYHKGVALQGLGRTAEAEEAFKKARELGYIPPQK